MSELPGQKKKVRSETQTGEPSASSDGFSGRWERKR